MIDLQSATCRRFGAACVPVASSTKLGIALRTQGLLPLNALRHPPKASTCGWYLWWGNDLGDAPDFFDALHVQHLDKYCPELLPYLALPPGWRVQIAPGHEDVWFDSSLLPV